jgi:hypothetical protein
MITKSDAAELEFLRVRVTELLAENESLRSALYLSRMGAPAQSNSTVTSSVNSTLSRAAADSGECSNCGRSVPVATLAVHSVHCTRNFRRCKFCDIVVATREEAAHIASARGSPADLLGALVRGDVERFARIFRHGVSPSASLSLAGSGDSPLHVIARAWRAPLVDELAALGANINGRNDAGETPLHVACGVKQKHDSSEAALATVTALIRCGADITMKTLLGDTAMQVASRARNHDLALLVGSEPKPSVATLASLRVPPSRTLPASRPSSAASVASLSDFN